MSINSFSDLLRAAQENIATSKKINDQLESFVHSAIDASFREGFDKGISSSKLFSDLFDTITVWRNEKSFCRPETISVTDRELMNIIDKFNNTMFEE